jgi:hypothetical protein
MAVFSKILFHNSNSGFEEGAFSPGWSAGNAAISNLDAHLGDFSAVLNGLGIGIVGAVSDAINVDETVLHNIEAWMKATNGLNLITNPDFETGDFTGYTANSATISTDTANSGTYSAKLVATGSAVTGFFSDAINVDETLTAHIGSYFNVTAFTAGSIRLFVRCYDAVDGGGAILDTILIDNKTAVTSGWVLSDKTIGPDSSTDIVYPSGTLSIAIRQDWSSGSTGTAYNDDVFFKYDFTGTHRLWIRAFDDVDGGGSVLSTQLIDSKSAITSDWEETDKTLGPSGSGADIIFPSGTKSVSFRQDLGSLTAGAGWLDDVKLIVSNSLTINGLEYYPSSRQNETMQSVEITPGGHEKTFDLGPEFIFLSIDIRNLSNANRALLLTFIRTTINYRQNFFDFTDDKGVKYIFCSFQFNSIDFSRDTEGPDSSLFSEIINIRVNEIT